MRYFVNLIVGALLWISICFNIFMISNYQSNCENIDSRWKADILYKMGHRNLDGDGEPYTSINTPTAGA